MPDEYAVTRATEEKTADGSRRVEVTQRRRDLTPRSGSGSAVGSTPERSREALEQEPRRLGVLGEDESLGDLSRLKPDESISLRAASRSHSIQSSHIAIVRGAKVAEGTPVLTPEEVGEKMTEGEAAARSVADEVWMSGAGQAVLQVPGREDVVLTREELERKIRSGEIILRAEDGRPPAVPSGPSEATDAAPDSFEVRGPVPAELAELLAKGGLKPGATHVVTRTVTETRSEGPRAFRYVSTDDGSGLGPARLAIGPRDPKDVANQALVRAVARRGAGPPAARSGRRWRWRGHWCSGSPSSSVSWPSSACSPRWLASPEARPADSLRSRSASYSRVAA